MAIKTLKCTVVMIVIKNNSQFSSNNASNRKAKGKLAFARKGQEDKSLALVFLVSWTKCSTLPENYWILSLACQKLELDPSKACELERQKRTEIDLEIDHGPQKNLTGTLTRSCSAPSHYHYEPIRMNLATISLLSNVQSTIHESTHGYLS